MNTKYLSLKFVHHVFLLGILAGIMTAATSCTISKSQNSSQPTEEIIVENISPERLYPCANDRMVYALSEDDSTLEQWSLDGTKQQTFSLPTDGHDMSSAGLFLLWVENDELIWVIEDDDNKQTVFSTPISNSETSEELLVEQTKELYTDTDESLTLLYSSCYATDEYLIFYEDGEIYLYERGGGKGLTHVNSSMSQTTAYPPELDEYNSPSSGMTYIDNRIIFQGAPTLGNLTGDIYNFQEYQLDSKQTHNIDSRCFPGAAIAADLSRKRVYYQISDDQSIWQYDCRTGKTSELISETQFKNCFEKNGLTWDDAYFDDALLVEKNKLYFIKNMNDPHIFSYSLADASLSYEKPLTEALLSTGFNKENDDHTQLAIIENKLLLYRDDYENDYYFSIDIPTAAVKLLGTNDMEKVYFKMIGLRGESSTGKWKPTAKKQTEQAAKIAEPLSVKEQLECISGYSDFWSKYAEADFEEDLDPAFKYFAVTDLDHNGKLEVIASTGPLGSGSITNTRYYQISADGTTLRPIVDHTTDIDIVYGFKYNTKQIEDSIDTAYYDKQSDTYYYCCQNSNRGGAGNYDFWLGAITLNNGMLTDRTYAYQEVRWNSKKEEEEVHSYSYQGGKETEISDIQDSLQEEFFAGLEKKKVNISWFTLSKDELHSKDTILEKTTKSYKGFKMK